MKKQSQAVKQYDSQRTMTCISQLHGDDGFYSNASSLNSPSQDEESGVLGKYDDPLRDPIVQLSLQEIQITGPQLMSLSVKELNKCLSNFPTPVVTKLKRCRRTLKNRGYAKNCRIKRIAVKNKLEQINTKLVVENRELKQNNRELIDELNRLRSHMSSVSVATQNLVPPNQSIVETSGKYNNINHTSSCVLGGALKIEPNASNGTFNDAPCSSVYAISAENEHYYQHHQMHTQNQLKDADFNYLMETTLTVENTPFQYNEYWHSLSNLTY